MNIYKYKMEYIFETERLRLRAFTKDDTKFIIELVNSPGWLKFIGDRNIRSEEQAKNYLENGPMKSYRENGFGLSMVETKDGRIKIGMCGIIKRDNLKNPDIGFAFLPQFTGQGYAFEIANATLTYATEILKLPAICAITVIDNERSIKLLEKIGLKFIRHFTFPHEDEELMLYSN
jgi:RimJ/RimL family protein N-acetyltransferase